MHPKILTRCMLEFVVTRLNQLPSSNGVSEVISPATIVLGKGPLDCQYNTIDFGSYVVLYTTTTNDMKRRSVPCIALNPKQPRMSLKAKKRPVLCEDQPAQTEERDSRDYGWISTGKVIVRRKQYSSYNRVDLV